VAGGARAWEQAGGARWPRLPRGCRPRAGWATTVRGRRGGWPPGWAGPEGPMGVPAGWARGPDAAQAGSGRSRFAAGSAVTWGNGWWACQDLNLGPHPYQVSRAQRCADRRFPRSLASVRGEGMRSNSPPGSAHGRAAGAAGKVGKPPSPARRWGCRVARQPHRIGVAMSSDQAAWPARNLRPARMASIAASAVATGGAILDGPGRSAVDRDVDGVDVQLGGRVGAGGRVGLEHA
jgi:hypothetical protein